MLLNIVNDQFPIVVPFVGAQREKSGILAVNIVNRSYQLFNLGMTLSNTGTSAKKSTTDLLCADMN